MSESSQDMRNLAANVRHARARNGLSQRDLVKALNEHLGDSPTNQPAVARIENGSREPRLGELVALAKVFFVELESLTWEPEAFEDMLENRVAVAVYEKTNSALLRAAQEREVARKELLAELGRQRDAFPANARGFLEREAGKRSDEYLSSHYALAGSD